MPSLKLLAADAGGVVKRFPFEIAFALAGTIAASVYIEQNNWQTAISSWCIRMMMIANLGLLLNLSATLYLESRLASLYKGIALHLLASGFAISLLFLLDPLNKETDVLRFILLSLGFHLLVAFAAFNRKSGKNDFWIFNKTLFLRFLTGVLYSVVLFLGLSAAVASCNLLFNFHFEWKTYANMWVWIAGMFQTLFVLSGVPRGPAYVSSQNSYPKGLKVFTQYVLIPLSSVYLIILLAYEIKILIEWNMPKGLVANLILGYAVFGILSLLLVYPIRHDEGNKWIRMYSRSFYILLIPLIALLILAIIARVRSYGITEERYFLIVLAIWLSFITIYFLSSKRESIVIIPVSLCFVTLLAVFGPQSAFNVSEKSQRNELCELFLKNKALKSGRLLSLDYKADSADADRIRNIVVYMVKFHGLESLQPMFGKDLVRVSDLIAKSQKNPEKSKVPVYRETIREQQIRWVLNQVGVDEETARQLKAQQYTIKPLSGELISVRNADFMVDLSNYRDSARIKLGNSALRITTFPGGHKFLLTVDSVKWMVNADDVLSSLGKEKLNAPAEYTGKTGAGIITVDPEFLTRKFLFPHYQVEVLWTEITYQPDKKNIKADYANAILLLTRR